MQPGAAPVVTSASEGPFMMKLLSIAAALCLTVSAANAQGYRYQGPPPYGRPRDSASQGDQIQAVCRTTRSRVTNDPRYSGTQQQQADRRNSEARWWLPALRRGRRGWRPLGRPWRAWCALAGCVTGMAVRNRDKCEDRAAVRPAVALSRATGRRYNACRPRRPADRT